MDRKQIFTHPANLVSDVLEFIKTSQPEMLNAPNTRPNPATLQLARALINEEVNKELLPLLDKMLEGAWSQELSAELMDHYVDTVYVAIWGCIAMALPFYAGWNEVQHANMSKFPFHKACQAHGCNHVFEYEKEIDGVKVMVTERCQGGRLVTRRNDNGKVAKPEGFKAPEMFQVLFEVWNHVYKQNTPGVLPMK